MGIWVGGKYCNYAVYHAMCNPTTTCQSCWEFDRQIMRAEEAQIWALYGKSHDKCHCWVDYMTDAEIKAFIERWGYNRQG